MLVYLSPQVPGKPVEVEYAFEEDKIKVKYITSEEVYEDVFDLSPMPNGELETESVETSLPFNPLISAKREEGVLRVELINYINVDSTELERFPEWIESNEYIPSSVKEEGVELDGNI